jgi:prepilin-type N-terminal cleavage/methylation domain-containing protein
MRNQGFTLLEVIAAAVLTAFVAAAALAGFRTAVDSRNAVRLSNEAQDALRFCAAQIEQDLASAARQNIVFEGNGAEPGLGLYPRLRMHVFSVRPARPGEPESDRQEVEYGLIRDEDTGRMVFFRRVCPVVGIETAEETAGGILTVLSDSVIVFDLRYFDGTDWTDEWVDTQRLPVLMQVLLAVREGDDEEEGRVYTRSVWMHFAREGTTTQEALDSAGVLSSDSETAADAASGGMP